VGGVEVEGNLRPSPANPDTGLPDSFVVLIPFRHVVAISRINGQWSMKGDPEVTRAMGEWIEIYYQ
jgi:hypothetical protein